MKEQVFPLGCLVFIVGMSILSVSAILWVFIIFTGSLLENTEKIEKEYYEFRMKTIERGFAFYDQNTGEYTLKKGD